MNKSKVFVFKEKIVCYALVFMCIMILSMGVSAMQRTSKLADNIISELQQGELDHVLWDIKVVSDEELKDLAKERTESGTILHDMANRGIQYRSESQENLRQIVALLKNKGQINLDALDDQGRTALDIAQQNNQPIMAAVLREAQFNRPLESTTCALEANPQKLPARRRSDISLSRTIHTLLQSSRLPSMLDQMKQASDDDIKELTKERAAGGTILHDIANRKARYKNPSQENLREIVDILINKGNINLDALDNQDQTALDIAKKNRQPVLAAILKEKGAHFSSQLQPTTHTVSSGQQGQEQQNVSPMLSLATQCANKLADNIRKDFEHGRMLEAFIRMIQASDDVIKELARERAEGGTILHEFAHRRAQYNNASQETLRQIVDILINRGEINLDSLDNQGQTALDIAQQKNQPVFVKILKEKGAHLSSEVQPTTHTVSFGQQVPSVELPETTFSEGVVGGKEIYSLSEGFDIDTLLENIEQEGQEQQPVSLKGTKRSFEQLEKELLGQKEEEPRLSFEELEKELLGQQGETLPEEEQRSKKRQRTGNPARVDVITRD